MSRFSIPSLPSILLCLEASALIAASREAVSSAPEALFSRGDANGDGEIDMSDAVFILSDLFTGGASPSCLDAADANDDGEIDLSDAIRTLGYLFLDALPLPAPFGKCGLDAVPDLLGCTEYSQCVQPKPDVIIDDFERPQAPTPWFFDNGAEFPGATGSLSAAPGHSGSGARLAFDMSGGGAYVSARLRYAFTAPVTAIAFWVKSPAGTRVRLRVVDQTSQTLQYDPPRPLHALDPAAWYRKVVILGNPSEHWGGANDGLVHGNPKEVDVLAVPTIGGATGAIFFDEVAVVDPFELYLDPDTHPTAPAPPSSADLSSLLGVNVHFTSDDRALDAARSAGFTWVRTDLFWSRVEKVAGVYDFSPWDQLVGSLEQRGMKYLAILCYGNALHTGASASPPTTPAAIDAFGDYAEAAARHFDGRAVRFEVWNEPNVSGFWPPAPSPTQYADLAKVANNRVSQGSDAALVAVGSISWLDFDFVQEALAADAGAGADALSWHPYLSRPESLPDHLLLMRSIVAASPSSGLDIWESEWGYTSASFGDGHSVEARNRQANLVSREILSAWAVGFPLIVYYDLRDDGTDPANGEHNFGLLARDYSAKPALHAVRTITSLAKERSLVGILQGGSSALNGLELEGPNDRVLMVWSHVPAASVRLLVPPSATGVDFLGNPLDLEPVGVGLMLELTVSEEAGPVFLTFPRS